MAVSYSPTISSEKNTDVVDQIRQVADIVDIVSERIELKKRGANYLALCPFHDDKNPSLSVSASKQLYKCFSCGAGGDAIGFVMEYDNLSFMQAIKKLAQKYGIAMPTHFEKNQSFVDPYADVKALYNFVKSYYHEILLHHKEGHEARAYLKQRGMTKKCIEDFALGFAPTKEDLRLERILKTHPGAKNKWEEKWIEQSGLLQEKRWSTRNDFLNGRIIFPIRNEKGETIAFGGRALDDRKPKYLNIAEKPWFEKNKTLYGIYENYQKIGRSQVTIVEGYFDVIACFLCGIAAVSPMGTALSEHQLQKISRYARQKKIMIFLDGDDAGKRASFNAAALMAEKEVDGEVVSLPNIDPCDFLFRYGPKGIEHLKKVGVNVYDYLIKTLKPAEHASPLEKKEALKQMMSVLEKMSPGIVRDDFVKKIETEFQVDVKKAIVELRSSFSKWREERWRKSRERDTQKNLPFYQHHEIDYVFFLLCNPEFVAQGVSIISLENIHHNFARYIYSHLCRVADKPNLTLHQIFDSIRTLGHFANEAEEQSAKRLAKMAIDYISLILAKDTEKYSENKEQQLADRINLLKLAYIADFTQWVSKSDEAELFSEKYRNFLLRDVSFFNEESQHLGEKDRENALMQNIMRIAREKQMITDFYQDKNL